MREKFSAFYSVPEDEREAAWSDATFVLDANILLNLYRFPLGTRRDLLEIFDNLGDRLWVPFHAALEYQFSRPGVIAEQQRKFYEVKKALDAGLDTMTQRLGALQLTTRHSIIDVNPIVDKISEAIAVFKNQLDELKKGSDFDLDSDAVRSRLDGVLAGRVGNPLPKEVLGQIQKEGELRFKSLMPPGYLDAGKGGKGDLGPFMYEGLYYERKYGDLIVWKQIIKHAQERKLKKIIFLTDDAKDDWWLTINSEGPKTIGPRPELREEIRREAEVEFFHMYDTSSFLKFASKNLGRAVPQKSIDEVKDIVRSARSEVANVEVEVGTSLNSEVGKRVRTWLQSTGQVPIQVLGHGKAFASINSKMVELSILIVIPGKDVQHLLKNAVIDSLVRKTDFDKLVIIVGGVDDHESAAEWFAREDGRSLGNHYALIYGALESEEEESRTVFKPQFAAGVLGHYLLLLS
ncbi:PIN-like domain-containing protein [Herbaspirillum frisingense]|uniref:PIN-like domain-containing protein n=1 Tax=Herbaspirillum frisingense TaxID=92645 RepID=UPI0039AFE9BF